MKAKSAGARKAIKRGRNRLPANANEPNGRKSRRANAVEARAELSEADAKSVVRERRIRENNILPFRTKDGKLVTAEQQADDPRQGYVVGRFLLDGKISAADHDALVKYGEDMGRFYGLTGIAFPSARAQNLFAVRGGGGEDGEDRITAAKAARSKAFALQEVITGQKTDRNRNGVHYDIGTGRKVESCVKLAALLDMDEARGWSPYQIGLLKKGASALRRYYGMG